MSKRNEELSEYAMEMILPIIKEYGNDLNMILNDDCAALIIIGFLNTSKCTFATVMRGSKNFV